HFWLQVLPAAGGDHRAELQEAMMRDRLEKYPDDFNANYTIGDILLNRGKAADAVSYFQTALKTNPASVIAATELGVALFTAWRLEEAELQFQLALQLDPTYTDARFDLASVEAARKEWDKAAADFSQVLKERPDSAKAHQHLGEVLFLWGNDLAEAGKDADAAQRYQEAINLRPQDAELHGRLGVALGRMGKLAEAQSELEAALRIDPTLEPAKRALEIVKSRMK
ncbi:MAG TPA: tetratricopeptide repeat protein, partial [Bryobacteraceae bacterium]